MMFLVFLLAIFLRAALLHRSVAYDEAYSYLSFIKTGFFDSYAHTYVSNNHLLNSLLTDGFLRIFGAGDVPLRLSAFLFGIGSIPMCYCLFKRWIDKRAGILVAFLLSIQPYHIRYSTESRGYSAFLFFGLLAVWNLLEGEKRRNTLSWILFAASLILAIFSNLFAVILVIPLVLFALILCVVQGPKKNLILGFGSSLFLAGVGVVLLYAPTMPIVSYLKSLWRTGDLPQHSFLNFTVYLYRYDIDFLMNLFGRLGWCGGWRLWVMLSLSILGVILGYRQGRWKETTLFLLLGVIPLVLAKVWTMNPVYRLFFYAIPFYLYFFVLSLLWLQDRVFWKDAKWRQSSLPGVALCALLFINPVVDYLVGEGSQGVDANWRRAHATVQSRIKADDFITGDLLGETANQEGVAVAYYWHEGVEEGRPDTLMDGDIGLWRLQFADKPIPKGYDTISAMEDLNILYRREKVSFALRWPIQARVAGPTLVLLRPRREPLAHRLEWDASTTSLAFTIPRGVREAVVFGEEFAVQPATPYLLSLQAEGEFRGLVRVHFFKDSLVNLNEDSRRFLSKGQTITPYLFKAFTWRYADSAQVVLRIEGSRSRDIAVRISKVQWVEATGDESSG